jgi:hypothetical protein
VTTGETRVVALHVSPHEGGNGEDLEVTIAEREQEIRVVSEGIFISKDGL